VLSIAALSLVAGLVGTGLGATTTLLATDAEVRHAQAQELRAKREPLYAEYLDAARALKEATGVYVMYCPKATEDPVIALLGECKDIYPAFHAAVVRFDKAGTAMRVYASPAVRAAAAAVAVELPSTSTTAFADGKLRKVDASRFNQMIDNFLIAMCADLQISPDQTCR